MGLYDEIRCEVPLPEGGAIAGVRFQTKSLPSPCLRRYAITAAGRLVDSRGNDLAPDGYLTFYAAEAQRAPGAPGGQILREYRARFLAGRLLGIDRVPDEQARSDRRHYGLASFRWFAAASPHVAEPAEE